MEGREPEINMLLSTSTNILTSIIYFSQIVIKTYFIVGHKNKDDQGAQEGASNDVFTKSPGDSVAVTMDGDGANNTMDSDTANAATELLSEGKKEVCYN